MEPSAPAGIGGGDVQWPMDKLLVPPPSPSAPSANSSQGTPAVILTTGGMNPVHRGHVQLLHQAAARLQLAGFRVAGMWISPSHDSYLQPKACSLGTVGLSAPFRVEVARRSAAEDQRVAAAAWEASQPGRWPDYPEVCIALQERLSGLPQAAPLLRPYLKGERVLVFYACGTDHAAKCGLYRGLDPVCGLGVVVVPREGEVPRAENAERLVFVAEPCHDPAVCAASSTKVRAALKSGDRGYLEGALAPQALRFLLHPTAEEHALFARDFSLLGVGAPKQRRRIYISLSSLLRSWDRDGEATLASMPTDALLFFGSKRSWVFPEGAAELKESQQQNPKYTSPAYAKLRESILEREARGLVFFLKPPGFAYNGSLYHGDPEAFHRASEWIQGHVDPSTGAHYAPLLLDPVWWRTAFDPSISKYTTSVETIVKNFANGAHDYPPVMELLHQSNNSLEIVA